MIDKEREAPLDRRRELAGIPAGYRSLGWDDMQDDAKVVIDASGKPVSAKAMLRSYARDWKGVVQPDADGLVLLGPPGWGKSLGAALVAMDVLDQGGWVRFSTFADLVDREVKLVGMSKDAERNEDWEKFDREELRLKWLKWECDLLVLDDVGKERRSASDLAADLFDQLVRRRVNTGKCTILTSNLGMSEWSTYNASMESFLFELGDVLEYVEGTDHRPRRSRPAREARRRGEG